MQLEVERLTIPVQTVPDQLLELKPSSGFGQSASLKVHRQGPCLAAAFSSVSAGHPQQFIPGVSLHSSDGHWAPVLLANQ